MNGLTPSEQRELQALRERDAARAIARELAEAGDTLMRTAAVSAQTPMPDALCHEITKMVRLLTRAREAGIIDANGS